MSVRWEHPLDGGLAGAVLDRLPVAVTVIDLDGRMLYYNEFSSAILDRKPEYLGQDVRACHEKAQSNAKIDRMLEAFRMGRREPFSYEAERYGKLLRVTFTPLEVDGRLAGCIQIATVRE